MRVEDALVTRNDVQHVEQLALVFVDALHLHVEHRIGVDHDAHVLLDPVGQPQFVFALRVPERPGEGRLRRHRLQRFELHQVAPPALADTLVEQCGKWWVGLRQPATWRHAIGLVVEALRKDAVEVGKDRLLHQLRMQARHPVDRVARQHRHVRHTHSPLARLVDQREAAQQLDIVADLLRHGREKLGVHVVDDLQMARQDATHHLDRPGLQRLVHQRVVGVAEDSLRGGPGCFPIEAVLVEQQPHHLGYREHRVRVVQVDADLVTQMIEGGVVAQIAAQ